MIDRHAQFSSIQFPADWGLPRYNMGQSVCVETDNPGTITGIEYVALGSPAHCEGAEIGWHYVVALDSSARRFRLQPISSVHEDVIQLHPPHPSVSYPAAVAV